jgi:hypothetical protein
LSRRRPPACTGWCGAVSSQSAERRSSSTRWDLAATALRRGRSSAQRRRPQPTAASPSTACTSVLGERAGVPGGVGRKSRLVGSVTNNPQLVLVAALAACGGLSTTSFIVLNEVNTVRGLRACPIRDDVRQNRVRHGRCSRTVCGICPVGGAGEHGHRQLYRCGTERRDGAVCHHQHAGGHACRMR